MTARVLDVHQENWVLKKRVKYLEARLTLTMGERDAARTALNNINMMEACDQIERDLGIKIGKKP